MAKIQFVTDSASDIPEKYVKQYGIRMLRFPIALEDREILDGADCTAEEFYQILKTTDTIPTHAQLTAFQMQEVYEQAWQEGYDALIYTCINFKGSSTGSNALMAKESFFQAHPEARDSFEIYVLDSKSYTYAYGYAVVEAAKHAQDGSMTAAEAVAQIQDWLDHNKILFTCFDLKFARKSGRVSAAAAILGGAMGIRPIMSFPDGDSKVLAKPRGDAKTIKGIVDMMQAEMEPGSPYFVINAALPEKNREILRACTDALGYEPTEVFLVGGVIAINAGPDLVGVIYRKKA